MITWKKRSRKRKFTEVKWTENEIMDGGNRKQEAGRRENVTMGRRYRC